MVCTNRAFAYMMGVRIRLYVSKHAVKSLFLSNSESCVRVQEACIRMCAIPYASISLFVLAPVRAKDDRRKYQLPFYSSTAREKHN